MRELAGDTSGERPSPRPSSDETEVALPAAPAAPAATPPAAPAAPPRRTGVGIDGPTTHVSRVAGSSTPEAAAAGSNGSSSAGTNGSATSATSSTAGGSSTTAAPPTTPAGGGAGRAPRGPAANGPGPAGPPGPPSGPFPAPPRRPSRGTGGPLRPGPSSGPMAATGPLMPGTLLVDRYRLVAEVGRDRDADAALWKARDVVLERDVALTLLVGTWQGDAKASAALSRATRSAHFEHPHAARILDVVRPGSTPLPTGVLGAAVAEWTPGRDLAELVADGPLRPSAALRVIEPLADAVAAAHRSGLVLGLDHPQRVRVSSRAATRLAFPMPRGEATNADDVHGLGALLYLLLTARWPGPEGSRPPAGLRQAPHGPDGAPVSARQLRPDLPVELAALVDRTLDEHGGIRTAAAVHRLVTQMRAGLEDDGVLLPVLEDGQTIDADDPAEVWHDEAHPEPGPDPARRRKLRVGVTALVLATLLILGFVSYQIISVVAGGGQSGPPVVVIPPETSAPSAAPAPSPAPSPVPPAPVPAGPVQLSSVAVYSPAGSPDNPTRINRAADNDPETTWSTSEYRQQLPSLKPGIGMMTTFTAPAPVSAVTVRSPSPGTRIEIRSAPAADVPLAQTQLLGTGTVADDEDVLRIPLQAAPPTGNLLVWITALGEEDDDEYVTELAEVTIERAGP
ncbi:protein kinase family protein [Actinomycetospora straminea]|uniref:Protein kinase family protein n=1 Tax=Actinomycetospora straminea TaxID=663607 RepID=A0ABP9E746_9PSEU|nr:protein kinase family protein [Actinomycetospora straminea]MDD7936781.1 protein kinase family protein [Actinomycetospora straminea]